MREWDTGKYSVRPKVGEKLLCQRAMKCHDPIVARHLFKLDRFCEEVLLKPLEGGLKMEGIHFEHQCVRLGMNQEGGSDLSLTIQKAGRSTLSEGKSFDIMGDHVVKKFDAVSTLDTQKGAREFSQNSDRLTSCANFSLNLIHGSDYSMGTHDEPERIERVGETALRILWSDGHESLYTWPFLRTSCPCAACKEGVLLETDPTVKPLELKPVGRYAMAIRWSDGHTTGIFSHELLRSICPCEECHPSQFTEG